MSKILLIGIDGLGGHYINPQNTPTIHSLMNEASYTKNMQCVLPTSSGPNWFSMLSGYDFENCANIAHTKSTILDDLHNEGKDYSFIYTSSVHSYIKGIVVKKHLKTSLVLADRRATRKTIKVIASKFPEFTFVHLGSVDVFGHMFGYGSRMYNWMAKRADSKVKKVLDSLKRHSQYNQTTVIITADHGGIKRGHGSNSKEEKTSFLVIKGPNIKKNHSIKKEVNIYDIAPTVAHIINLKQTKKDGKILKEIFLNL